jgi:SAM-dependent methyltransferase
MAIDPRSSEDAIRQKAAQRFGVSPDIHPDDHIWHFIRQHPNYPTLEAAVQNYFVDGATSAQKLSDIIRMHVAASASPLRVLEFASGYGMVTRHLARVPITIELTACDIHKEAIDFIQQRLNQHVVLSRSVPEEANFEQSFDVVFALSFFSHMPRSTFARWLKRLFDAVAIDGILVFTTHGLLSRRLFGDITLSEDGFWFMPSSEQGDLDPAEYGTSVTTPGYVVGEISRLSGASLAEYQRGFWWGHQDVYVVSRP